MPPDPLRIVSRAANALASAPSLRDGCSAALEQVADGLSATFAILARPAQDSGIADVVASNGIHAADYRRLESRLPKSGLWRILHAATPFVIDDLAQDPSLNFLAYSTRATMLLAVPVKTSPSASALLAIAFERAVDEDRTLRLLDTVAALFAHSMRVDQTVVSDNERLLEENRRLKLEIKERYDFGNLIGNSGGMRQALDQVRQIARSNAAVLLRGEPGTGKDTFANAIRYNSLRSKRPFVKLDLTSTTAAQLVSDLDGRLKHAEGGTIFLDEITAGSRDVHRMLLDAIREAKSATRDSPSAHNVRFIVATSRDIDLAKSEGRFDVDLFAELTAFTIFLPPLRERRSDILLLADHFLEQIGRASCRERV